LELERKAAELPRRPGVYLFKDARGRVLYVGKASDLRGRVASYLRPGGDGRPRIAFLEGRMADLETVLCRTPAEALMLEDTLIKKFKPPYNVRLKDDKNYLLIRVDMEADFPRLLPARRRRDDGAWYFGPYPTSRRVWETITALRKVLGLRDCKDWDFRNRSRPCIKHDMGHCAAPCVGLIGRRAYRERVAQAVAVLKGRGASVQRALRREMEAEAAALHFERAQVLKERVGILAEVCGAGPVTRGRGSGCDAFALLRSGADLDLAVLNFREGRLAGGERFHLVTELPDEELLSTAITRYYRGGRYVPTAVLVPFLPHDAADLAEWLGERRGAKVAVHRPVRGEKARLLELAAANVREAQAQRVGREAAARLALERLAERLELLFPPRVIHCFDVSHTQGTEITASRVALQGGEPEKALYRRFKVRNLAGQDDFAALTQVVLRSLRLGERKGEPRPDLVVVDGGRGQVGRVAAELAREDPAPPALAGIAKARPRRRGGRGRAPREPVPERLVRPGRPGSIPLPEDAPETRLLARLRDEAHRFAITYHRKLRGRTGSFLERIPGVGPARRKLLLREFGSLKGIRSAGLERLKGVVGLPERVAEEIHRALGEEGG